MKMKNKKNLSKRGLALFLVLIMCLGMLNLTAFAAEGDGDEPTVEIEIPVTPDASAEGTEPAGDTTPVEEPAEAPAEAVSAEVMELRALMSKLDAFDLDTLNEDNIDEFQTMGDHLAELSEIVFDGDEYDGMMDDMMRFQALAEKVTGGMMLLSRSYTVYYQLGATGTRTGGKSKSSSYNSTKLGQPSDQGITTPSGYTFKYWVTSDGKTRSATDTWNIPSSNAWASAVFEKGQDRLGSVTMSTGYVRTTGDEHCTDPNVNIKVKVLPVYLTPDTNLGYTVDYDAAISMEKFHCDYPNSHSYNANHRLHVADFHPTNIGLSVRSGYEWKGWIKYTSNVNLNNVKNPPFSTYVASSTTTTDVSSTGEHYIYMVYQKPTNDFTLNYNGNGGTASKAKDTHSGSESSYSFTPDATASRTGYTFKGWSTASGADNAGNKTTSVSVNANSSKTVYAIWEAIDYTITYTDGVTDEEVFADQVFSNKHYGDTTPTYTAPDTYTDDNGDTWKFKGWSPTVDTTVTGSKTYTAQWEKTTPTSRDKTVTVVKTFIGKGGNKIAQDKVPADYRLDYSYTYGGTTTTGSLNASAATKDINENDHPTLTWTMTVKVDSDTNSTNKTAVTFTEVNYAVDGYTWAKQSGINSADESKVSGTVQISADKQTSTQSFYNYYDKVTTATVTWYNENGTAVLDGPKEFTKGGTEPTTDVVPTKAEDANYTYEFDKWVKMDDSTEDNIKYKATFTATPKPTYTVTYTWTNAPDGVTLPAGGSYTSGTEVTVDTTFTQDQEIKVNGATYKFSGWNVPETITVTDGKFTMPAAAVTINGTWTKTAEPTTPIQNIKVRYIVQWLDEDGNELKSEIRGPEAVGTEVSVTDDDKADITKDGSTYKFDAANAGNVLSGELKAIASADDIVTLTLVFGKTEVPNDPPVVEPDEVLYLVQWVDTEGNELKDMVSRTGAAGATVTVTDDDKVIDGYVFDAANAGNVLEGTLSADGLVTLKLVFNQSPVIPIIPDGPVIPDDNTNPDDNGNDVIIDDPDVPLAENPETEIPEEDVPLAGTPEIGIEIEDDDVPLADVPTTGDNSGVWIVLTLLSGISLIWLALEDRKRKTNTK